MPRGLWFPVAARPAHRNLPDLPQGPLPCCPRPAWGHAAFLSIDYGNGGHIPWTPCSHFSRSSSDFSALEALPSTTTANARLLLSNSPHRTARFLLPPRARSSPH